MDPLVPWLNAVARTWADHAIAVAWQATVLVALLLALDALLRRRARAALRCALWMLVTIKLVLPPGLALPTSPWYWRTAPIEPQPATANVSAPRAETAFALDDPLGLEDSAYPTWTDANAPARPSLSLEGWLFLLWLAGGVLLLGFIARRMGQVRQIVARASDAEDDVQAVFRNSARRLGLRGLPRLAVSDDLSTPAVCGLIRPVVILPARLEKTLDATRLNDVFLHELAHFRRWDPGWNHLQTLLLVAYWWHPLVWVAHLRLRQVREEATDEAVVVARCDHPAGYAETLVEVARSAVARPLVSLGLVGILEGRTALKTRIERLLNLPVPTSCRLGLGGWCALALAGAVLLPMAQGESQTPAQQPAARPDIPDSSGVAGTPLGVAGSSPATPAGLSIPADRDLAQPGHARVREKLEGLVLKEVAFPDTPLLDVLRSLKVATRLADPGQTGLNVFFNPNPADESAPAPRTEDVRIRLDTPLRDVRLIDALEAIVKAASRPVHYSVEAYGVIFHLGPQPPRLVTRVFRVDGSLFAAGLKTALGDRMRRPELPTGQPQPLRERSPSSPATDVGRAGGGSNHGLESTPQVRTPNSTVGQADPIPPATTAAQELVRTFFESAGVSLVPPNALFYNDRLGLLMVRATVPEIEIVEQTLEVLNAAPPIVQIDTRLLEVPEPLFRELSPLLKLDPRKEPTAGTATPGAILDPAGVRALHQALRQHPEVRTMASPGVTTLSGRQAGIQMAPSTNAPPGTESVSVALDINARVHLDRYAPAGAGAGLPSGLDLQPNDRSYSRTIEIRFTGQLTESGPVSATSPVLAAEGDETAAPAVYSVRATGYIDHRLLGDHSIPDGHTLAMATARVLDASVAIGRPARRYVLLVTPTVVDAAGKAVQPPGNVSSP